MAKKLAADRWLFTVVVLLVLGGLVMVYSASAGQARGEPALVGPFLATQLAAAAVGGVGMVAAMRLDYRHLARPAVVYALFGAVLCLLVAVLFAPPVNGTRRWLFVGGVSIQPSELAKLGLVPFLAYQLERKQKWWGRRGVLLPAGIATGLVAGLVLLQPDFGTAALLVMTATLVLFLAGLPLRFLGWGTAAVVPLLGIAMLAAPYRRERLLAFLDPAADPLGAGYQPLQSLIAVGSGGVTGRGLGDGVQKLHFLPHPQSDFIFSIVGEELGLVGAVALLALFAVFAWRGFRAGAAAPDEHGRYLAWGLTGLLVVQALLHASVALALLPTKGIPLPFISYGGSSLVTSLVACGVLLNVSEHAA